MTMLLVAKGPSAKKFQVSDNEICVEEKVYKKPPRMETGTVGEAWKLIDHIDYAFMCDYLFRNTFKKKHAKFWAKQQIKRLVLPSYPLVYPEFDNIEIANRCLPSHIDHSFNSDEFKECVSGIPYYIYQNEASIINNYGIESYNEITHVVGTSYIAVCFALARGFKHFVLNGFDPEVETSKIYNPMFQDNGRKNKTKDQIMDYYQICFYRIVEKIISSGSTYEIFP